MIRLAFQIYGRGWLRSEDTVMDRYPYDDDAIADAIEHLPPDAANCFENRVCNFADDLRWL
jgi:hypothetical protein